MISQALIATYDNPLIVVDGADFDGTNDYMTRGAGLTGAADSKSGILSLWYRVDGGDGTFRTIIHGATTLAGTTSRFRVRHENDNTLLIVGVNAAGSTILSLPSATAYTAGATWLHILASWDLATAATHLYINGVDDKNSGSVLATDDSIDYTLADWAIGAQASGGTKTNGCLAGVYLAPGQYVGFSNSYFLRKYLSRSGKPVHLGTTGALPTGTAPLIYQNLSDGETVANFATNRGTGGNFSITGTLGTASSSPSD